MTIQPIRRPITASTAASHAGTLPEQSAVSGWAEVVCVVGAVVELGKLFALVKMYGFS